MTTQVQETLLNMLTEVNLDLRKEDVKPENGMIASGYVDSYAFVEFIGNVEQHFGIMIEDDELVESNIGSISKLATFISKKKA